MMYSYDRLWKRLTDKNITNSEISRMADISAHTLSKMQKNEPITLDNLAKIATAKPGGREADGSNRIRTEKRGIQPHDSDRRLLDPVSETTQTEVRNALFFKRRRKMYRAALL